MLRRAIGLLCCGLLLAGCGYRPLYASGQNASSLAADLAAVGIAPIPDRLGYLVRTRLLNQVNPFGQRQSLVYRLEVALTEERIELAVQNDRTATRFDIRVLAIVRLIHIQSDSVVFEAASRSSASYNVVTSDFATLVTARDAEDRVADQLSEDIALKVSLFLERQKNRQS